MKQQRLRRTGLLNKDSLGVARIYQLQQLTSLAATKNWTTTRLGCFVFVFGFFFFQMNQVLTVSGSNVKGEGKTLFQKVVVNIIIFPPTHNEDVVS